jgi:hypothetical protein
VCSHSFFFSLYYLHQWAFTSMTHTASTIHNSILHSMQYILSIHRLAHTAAVAALNSPSTLSSPINKGLGRGYNTGLARGLARGTVGRHDGWPCRRLRGRSHGRLDRGTRRWLAGRLRGWLHGRYDRGRLCRLN